MMPIDWGWLAVTLVQALGASLALAALGFAYERAIRESISLLAALEQGQGYDWLALGAGLLAAGMAFSGASWLQKGGAIGLALSLGWLAWGGERGLAGPEASRPRNRGER